MVVEIKAVHGAESVSQGRAQQGKAGGGANQGEGGQVQSQARRLAVNTILQGSAADMIKMAMIKIHSKLNEEKLDALMLLQIHDELVFDVGSTATEYLAKLVKEEMVSAIPLSVPIKVNVETGSNWLEAK